MSKLSELTDLPRQLAVLVRENREEIADLRARVKALEGRQSFQVDDFTHPHKPIIVDLSGIDLK